MSRPRKPKQEQATAEPSAPTSNDVTISIRIGEVETESGFSLDLWKRAKADPSTTQFIIGTLREALEAKGYKEEA